MGYRIRNTDNCVGTCGPNEIIQLDFLSFFMPACCVNTSHNSLKWSFLNNKQNGHFVGLSLFLATDNEVGHLS